MISIKKANAANLKDHDAHPEKQVQFHKLQQLWESMQAECSVAGALFEAKPGL